MPTSIIMQKLDGSSGPMTGRCGDLVAVLEGGLVAVVAVGDEDRLGGHQPSDDGMRFLVGHDPEPVFDTEVIGRHQRRPIAQTGLDRAVHLFGRRRDRARTRG